MKVFGKIVKRQRLEEAKTASANERPADNRHTYHRESQREALSRMSRSTPTHARPFTRHSRICPSAESLSAVRQACRESSCSSFLACGKRLHAGFSTPALDRTNFQAGMWMEAIRRPPSILSVMQARPSVAQAYRLQCPAGRPGGSEHTVRDGPLPKRWRHRERHTYQPRKHVNLRCSSSNFIGLCHHLMVGSPTCQN